MELVYTETSKEHEGVTFMIYIAQDETQVRGNALASGDSKVDTQAENEILRRLRNGDVWAWATVKVEARRGDKEGSDYLGCCNYRNCTEFMQPGGYYDDMKATALAELLKEEEK